MKNKLITQGENSVLKIGNQIAITNKLLDIGFDYVKWWDELENYNNKRIIELRIEISIVLDGMLETMGKEELTIEEVPLYTSEKKFELNNYRTKFELLKNFMKLSKVDSSGKIITSPFGKRKHFKISDNP
ncbi:MAG: hypothetical protein NTX03_06055 [Bacteroidetes bacterium]|nr:hypothetical protein [Bacteroidota bacterium]